MTKDTQKPPASPAPSWYYMPASTKKTQKIKEKKQPAKQQSTWLTLAWYAALIFFGWVLGAML